MPRSHPETSGGAVTSVPIATAFGDFTAHFSDYGLAQLDFPENVPPASCRAEVRSALIRSWLAQTEQSIAVILSGKTPINLPPLDLRAGTEFQQRVWKALLGISMGETKSYGDIAREVGSPMGTRAVGAACGANPIPLIIPCHRVVARGGKLGGFAGGLDWKKRLLALERFDLLGARWNVESLAHLWDCPIT